VTPHGYAALDPAKAWLQGRPLSGATSSDLLRARQSLRYAAPDMAADASCDRRLRELSFGDWEGRTYEELKDSDTYRRWLDDPASVAPPGGESLAQFRSRIGSWLSEQSLADNRPPLLVATHGGTIRMIAALLRPGSDFWSLDTPPGSLHAVYGTGGGDIRRIL
jgi:alpha-ribazole phosphatase